MLHKFRMHQEPNKTILIIKSEAANISQATTFLGKRDWNIRICMRLQDAISAIAEAQPQFVMVSIDHPNKNIRSFIRILMQSFPNRVIVFAEKPHVLTYHYFNEIGSQYNIYPPVSGPAIERTLLSYYKSQLGPGDTKVRIFKGPAFNKIHKNEYWAYNPRTPLAPLEVMSSVKAKEILSIVEESPISEGAVDNVSAAAPITATPEKPPEQVAPLGEVTTAVKSAGPIGKVNATSKEESTGSVQATTAESAIGEVKTVVTSEAKTGEVQAAPAKKAPQFKLKIQEETEVKFNLVQHQESLISRAAHEALEKTVLKGDGRDIDQVEVASDMSCIVVESTRFSGYLIAALGKNRELDPAFVESLRQRIFKYLKDNGEELNESDQPLRLTLQKVSFKKWAGAEAEFLRQAVHKKEEVSIAFFPHRHLRVHFEDSADEKMAKIRMDEIQADVPVDFNLYIYLEENKRYINYTKKGNSLLASQKQRLERQGLKYMHVYKTDIPEFNKYRTQNYLNSTIEHFHAELNQKSAV